MPEPINISAHPIAILTSPANNSATQPGACTIELGDGDIHVFNYPNQVGGVSSIYTLPHQNRVRGYFHCQAGDGSLSQFQGVVPSPAADNATFALDNAAFAGYPAALDSAGVDFILVDQLLYGTCLRFVFTAGAAGATLEYFLYLTNS